MEEQCRPQGITRNQPAAQGKGIAKDFTSEDQAYPASNSIRSVGQLYQCLSPSLSAISSSYVMDVRKQQESPTTFGETLKQAGASWRKLAESEKAVCHSKCTIFILRELMEFKPYVKNFEKDRQEYLATLPAH